MRSLLKMYLFNKYLVYSPVRISQVGMGEPFTTMLIKNNTIEPAPVIGCRTTTTNTYAHKSSQAGSCQDSRARPRQRQNQRGAQVHAGHVRCSRQGFQGFRQPCTSAAWCSTASSVMLADVGRANMLPGKAFVTSFSFFYILHCK